MSSVNFEHVEHFERELSLEVPKQNEAGFLIVRRTLRLTPVRWEEGYGVAVEVISHEMKEHPFHFRDVVVYSQWFYDYQFPQWVRELRALYVGDFTRDYKIEFVGRFYEALCQNQDIVFGEVMTEYGFN